MTSAPTATLTLRVAEAVPKDVGRGIVRLDPVDMAVLGVEVGEILEVRGKRAAPAKVIPAYPDDRGQGIVQLDGITRENAQVSLGETVELRKAEASPARLVVLTPLTRRGAFLAGRDSGYVKRLLEGLAVAPGDRVRLTLLAGHYQEFAVAEASPKGVVVIGSLTTVRVEGDKAGERERPGVTYEDIGGLRQEIQRIREMIELPLKHPELFERLGIDPPKGVLLYGPPGCGKTLIARAVASETDAYFTHVSGPEVIHKFYGESEAHLRAIFERASQNAPAIIFLDELDAIASRREEVRGDQQVERRVVAQLLALMDGLKSRGQVIVIGATNLPQMLDPALRRPGRFDREIALSAPDQRGRRQILDIHTRGMPLAPDVDLEDLAEITHGFVGADLEALCREAAMAALRRALPQLQLDAESIPYEAISQLEVAGGDFAEARREVEPSALREFFTEVPNVTWEDVGGLEEPKQVLRETIQWPLRYPEVFQQTNTTPAKGVLLTGPPGTGKTLLAKAVANESGANFISVKGPALLSMWVGESERGIREVFKRAKQVSPCVIFFDEIDAIAPTRGAGGDSHVGERVVSQLLTEMDGMEQLQGVVVLAATNRPDILDPALLRPGRFDLRIELPLPDEGSRQQIFRIHTRGKPLAADVDLAALARATAGLAGSDIEAICRQASMLAIRELLQGRPDKPTAEELAALRVGARHFDAALQGVKGLR